MNNIVELKRLFSSYFELDPTIPNGIRWKDGVNNFSSKPAGTFDTSRGYYRTPVEKVKYKNTDIIKVLNTSINSDDDELVQNDMRILQESYRKACDLVIRLMITVNSLENEIEQLKNELDDERKKRPTSFQMDFSYRKM